MIKHKLIKSEEEFKYFINNLEYENFCGKIVKFEKDDIESILDISFKALDGFVYTEIFPANWNHKYNPKDLDIIRYADDYEEYFYANNYDLSDDFILNGWNIPYYPFIIVYDFERTFDRCGNMETILFDIVAFSEFLEV